MATYLISDTHFDHANVIKYCNRPFKNVTEMQKVMIEKWNQYVMPEDTVFHLGDLVMHSDPDKLRGLLNKLNGTKHLILGNHDRMKPFTYVEAGFTSVHTSLHLQDNIYLNHDPSVKCVLKDSDILLHGHVHTLYKSLPEKNCINMSCEMWDYRPTLLQEALMELMELKS